MPLSRRFYDERGYYRIDWLVRAAPFPVYGLSGHSLGFTCGGEMGYAARDQLLTEVTLGFADPPGGAADRHMALTTMARGPAWSGAPADWVHLPLDSPLFDEDGRPFVRHRTLADARQAGSAAAHLLIDQLAIAGQPCAARLQFWPRPDHEWRVTVQHVPPSAGPVLVGTGLHLSKAEVLDLIEGLVIINARDDLLARYQTESERRDPPRLPPDTPS